MLRKIVQNSFLGGQLDAEMLGRQDVEKYHKGGEVVKNLVLHARGAMFKRPGTNLAWTATTFLSGKTHRRLVPFAYTVDEGWAILFADGAAKAVRRDGTAVDVATDGTAPLFTGAAVDEFDFCQSGDVLFLAHPDYPPARIEHTVSGGTHSFTLRKMDITGQLAGVPSIAKARVEKIEIKDCGGIVTECYKATAVYDGVETVASLAYLKRAPDGSDVGDGETLGTASYDGTSYHAPWTQSQTITLYVNVPTRGGVSPDEIRIYRKQGSGYGLVGVIRGSEIAAGSSAATFSGYIAATYHNTKGGVSQDGEAGVADAIEGDPPRLGMDRPGFRVEGGFSLSLTAGAQKTVTVRFCPGSVTYALNQANDSVTFTYRPSNAARWKFTLGDATRFVRTDDYGAPNATRTIARAGGETDAAWLARWRAELVDFADGIGAAGVHTVSLSSYEAANIVEVEAYKSASGRTASEYGVLNSVNVFVPADADVRPEGTLPFVDNFISPDMSITPPKAPDAMLGPGDYPSCVCISRQRLVWASTRNEPSRVIMSQVGDFYTYAPHETLVPDDPIDFQLSATRFPEVNHIVEMRRLIMFNGDAEWIVGGEGSFTYESVNAVQHSAIGAAEWLKPVECNNMVLFAERTGQAVRRYSYQLEDDGYGGEDVSIFAQSIFRDRKIVAWAYQQHPHSTCWCVLSDGTLASLTFMREQRTVAWATHELGGSGKARGICATHALAGTDDSRTAAKESEVALLVERGGAWTVEVMRPEPMDDGALTTDAVAMDSCRVLAAGSTRRSGTVAVTTAGSILGNNAVEAGAVEGYAFECRFRTMPPVMGGGVGQGQTDIRYVHSVHLRLMRAVGGKVWAEGVPEAQATRLEKDAGVVTSGRIATPRVDERADLVLDENRDGRVNVAQDGPWPFGVLMIETDLECEEDEGRGR